MTKVSSPLHARDKEDGVTTDQSREWHQHRKWSVPDIAQPAAGDSERRDAIDRLHTASRWPWWMLDTVKTRQHTSPPERADALTDVILPDHEGRSVRLGDLWRDGPAVIVWLRQFGCPFCRASAVQLNRARSRFEENGAPLVLIGQGAPHDAASFRRRLHIDLPVLADKERVSYFAAGTKLATLGELVGPAAIRKAVVAMARQRVVIGRNTADEAQLGGTMIIDPDGRVAWAHLPRTPATWRGRARSWQLYGGPWGRTRVTRH
jgi:peroxiredoxin